MSETRKESEQQKLTTVTLKKSHKHAGKPYEAGASIPVNEADLEWLVANEVIDRPKDAAASPVPASGATQDTKTTAKS